MEQSVILNPTLACGNCLNFKEDLDILKATEIRMIHIDIMDGHYVPNLCFSLDIIRRIKENYPFLIDVHLMVTNPQDYIEELKDAGADMVSFHLDAYSFPLRLLSRIRNCGMKGGIALNPAQPVSMLSECLNALDFVLIMGVEPGFSGQAFIPAVAGKAALLDRMRKETGRSFLIEADGGIDDKNMEILIKNGTNILVSGAFGIFKGSKSGLMRDCMDTQERIRSCLKQR